MREGVAESKGNDGERGTHTGAADEKSVELMDMHRVEHVTGPQERGEPLKRKGVYDDALHEEHLIPDPILNAKMDARRIAALWRHAAVTGEIDRLKRRYKGMYAVTPIANYAERASNQEAFHQGVRSTCPRIKQVTFDCVLGNESVTIHLNSGKTFRLQRVATSKSANKGTIGYYYTKDALQRLSIEDQRSVQAAARALVEMEVALAQAALGGARSSQARVTVYTADGSTSAGSSVWGDNVTLGNQAVARSPMGSAAPDPNAHEKKLQQHMLAMQAAQQAQQAAKLGAS